MIELAEVRNMCGRKGWIRLKAVQEDHCTVLDHGPEILLKNTHRFD